MGVRTLSRDWQMKTRACHEQNCLWIPQKPLSELDSGKQAEHELWQDCLSQWSRRSVHNICPSPPLHTHSQEGHAVMEDLCWLLSHEEERFGVAQKSILCNSNASQTVWFWRANKITLVSKTCYVNVCHWEGRKDELFGGRWLGEIVRVNTSEQVRYKDGDIYMDFILWAEC